MLVFDIETDGLLDTISELWCLCVYDTQTNKMHRFDYTNRMDGVMMLQEALNHNVPICGHNIINYDIPALEKLFWVFKVERSKRHLVVDTLILARLIYSNIDTIDLGLMKANKLPKSLFKSHSLKAWGYRLGEHKGEYGEITEDAWGCFNEEMLDYCEQDVRVTYKLYEKLTSHTYSTEAITLEHEVQWLMSKQERNGFPFDIDKAHKLEALLRGRAANITYELLSLIPQIPDKVFVPKRDNKAKGYKAGVPIQRYKDFNPNSRTQIEYVLRTMYHYEPQEAELYDIPDGIESYDDFHCFRLKLDEETFSFIKSDPNASAEVKRLAELLDESLLLKKRLGQLADGSNAWLTSYNQDTKCIHGRVIANGCVSGRASHSTPNMAQIPSIGSAYGKECRELFNSGEWYQAGIDACGLELRCLAHYMFPYDKGDYASEILNGDIHTKNQLAAGLPTRSQAKTFIYGFLYGAGDAKVGKIINGTAADGKKIKQKFLKAIPALKSLREAVQNAIVETERGKVIRWKRHYLKGLDGRLLHVRSVHSALNLLLQSAGALICKKWIVETEKALIAKGYKHGWDGDFAYMAWVHKIHCAL